MVEFTNWPEHANKISYTFLVESTDVTGPREFFANDTDAAAYATENNYAGWRKSREGRPGQEDIRE